MKQIKKFLLLIFLFFFMYNSVNAGAGFSGIGSPKTGGSGSGGGCSGGYCLRSANGLLFSLVDIENLTVLQRNYMFNETSAYYKYFKEQNYFWGNKLPNCIIGKIEGNSYSTDGENNYEKIPNEESFGQDSLNKIIPKSKSYINFDVNKLEEAIIIPGSCDTSDGCKITEGYEKIVLFMLKKAGIVDNSYSKVDELPMDIKTKLNKYRIIIEPIYSFATDSVGKASTKYMFVTIKGIANIMKETGKEYGFVHSQLYNNLIATENNVGLINNPIFEGPGNKSHIDLMSDVQNGAGYAIVKLTYNTPDICLIKKDASNNLLFVDSVSSEFNNDTSGDKFEYFINQCSCDAIDNSLYKDELLNNSILKSKYDNLCGDKKKCDYELNMGSYTFYKNDGNITNDYKEFLNSCGCNNEKSLELKFIFNEVYADKCNASEIITPHGKFGVCTVDNKVWLDKEKYVNEYCTRTCKEEINFNNVIDTSSKTYNAGEYFELDYYPVLKAEKNCVLDFKYDKWEGEYSKYLKLAAEAYSNWKKYESVSVTTGSCGNKEDPDTEYYYNFNWIGYNVNLDGLTLSSYNGTDSAPSTCGYSENYSSIANSYKNEYSSYAIEIEKLKAYMNSCNNAIDFEGTNFYDFESNLEFHYQQDIIEKDKTTPIWNENRSVDDSKMLASNRLNRLMYCNGNAVNTDSCNFSEIELYDNISGNSIQSNRTKITSTTDLSRSESFEIKYTPSVPKYVAPLTGYISTNSAGTLLGPVYDLDPKSLEKNGNNNSFKFNILGENSRDINSLYRQLLIKNPDALTRKCTYNINNDIFDCVDGECTKGIESEFNFIYRIIDPKNVDPNERLGTNDGFKNWNNEKGKTVLKEIQNSDTYNPENLEYSFTLNSATIQEIRKYNNGCEESGKNCKLENAINYSNSYESYSALDCNSDGNECISNFITELDKNNGEFGSKIATNISGRDKWKYLEYSESKGYFINTYKKDDANFNNLLGELQSKGVEVTP